MKSKYFLFFFSSSKHSEVSLPALYLGCCLLSFFPLLLLVSAAASAAARTVVGPRTDMTLKGLLV